MSATGPRVPIFMRDLADVAARVLQEELGLDVTRAAEVGLLISRATCAEFSGELVYVPRGLSLEIAERDRELYDYYLKSGKDATATARKFNIGIQWVYTRVRTIRAALQAESQRNLFDPPSEPDEGEPA